MQTILMIEDNPDIMKINRAVFKQRYRVLEAVTLKEGREILERETPDLIILDIMLPDGSGLEYCEEIRSTLTVPLLFLTALGENQQIVEGLKRGGDDYLTKPYDLDVLSARVEVLLRRHNAQLEEQVLRAGTLEISKLPHVAKVEGRDLLLTPRELSLLELLLRQRGQFISTRELYELVWGMEAVDVSPVKQHIHNIRRKLGESAPVAIEAQQGKGYRLI